MKKLSILACISLLFASSQAFANDVWNYQVTATKLDESRNNLSPKTGGSSFSFSQKDVENLPQGQATPLNQVLLRAPSVAQNAHGQLYVRGDHANLQYRINGVILPEGISGFGQSLVSHFADKIDLLTGAMPAQYGLRTAGVVDIKTKSGAFAKGGRSEVMVGGNQTLQLNQQISGSKGNLNYYLNATYLQNNRGVESPTAAKNPIHDDTSQDKLFGYFSYLIDAGKRLNVIVSNATNRFQIPNNPNQSTNYALNGFSDYSSANLREKQTESSKFAIASLQGVTDSDVDYQVSLFSRYSQLEFKPDYAGDLMFNGLASNLNRSSFANGAQGDFSFVLNDKNTLRAGFVATNDAVRSSSKNWVFNIADDGTVATDPSRIDESSAKNSQTFGAYLQNEWKAIDKLTINYGARFDVSRAYANEQQLSPRFGAVYDLDKATKIHAGFARYFTPPPTALISATTLSRFQNTTNASENVQNDKVKSERTNYYDVGISHKFSSYLTVGLDGFYKQIKNLLDEGQFGNAPIYTPFNYRFGKAYGLEFKADYAREKFASYFNFSVQNATGKNVVSGQYLLSAEEIAYIAKNRVTLDHTQTYTASAGASYSWLQTKFSADAIYGSGLRTGNNNVNTMPSYLQVNAAAARDFDLPVAGKINLRLSALNLFDAVYQFSNGSGIGIAASQYSQRRTLYLTVSKAF